MSFSFDFFLAKEWYLSHRSLQLWPDWSEYMRLRSAYQSSDRAYHTWEHIHATCQFVRAHYDFQPLVILALFYHDVVYDINRKDNERESARVWEEYARRRKLVDVKADQVKTISELIIMTEKHRVEEDQPVSFAIMCDADMSIFVSDPSEYQRYPRNIWQEYGSFGRDKFVAGRLQFLTTVTPENLFYTSKAKGLVEKARANLDWERQTLEQRPEEIVGR